MLDAIGWLAAVAGLGVLFHYDFGKKDRRFKTGYKDNVVPVQTPIGPRIGWTATLWLIAAACLAGQSVMRPFLTVLAFAICAGATWKLYPQFWSRYQRNGTSNAAFFAARATMCCVVGGIGAYFAAGALGQVDMSRDPATRLGAESVQSPSGTSETPLLPSSPAIIETANKIATPNEQAMKLQSTEPPLAGLSILQSDAGLERSVSNVVLPIDEAPPYPTSRSDVDAAARNQSDSGGRLAGPGGTTLPLGDDRSPSTRPSVQQRTPPYDGGFGQFAGVPAERGVVVTRGDAGAPRVPPMRQPVYQPRVGPQGDGP